MKYYARIGAFVTPLTANAKQKNEPAKFRKHRHQTKFQDVIVADVTVRLPS